MPSAGRWSALAAPAQNTANKGSKPVPTILGEVTVTRPYFLCTTCHDGQFPADAELDIVHTELSPGVGCMQALVGQHVAFDHGRQQLELLAGLDVTTKPVERVAEAIGADAARRDQLDIDRTMRLDMPRQADPFPCFCVEMDGTGAHVVKKK